MHLRKTLIFNVNHAGGLAQIARNRVLSLAVESDRTFNSAVFKANRLKVVDDSAQPIELMPGRNDRIIRERTSVYVVGIGKKRKKKTARRRVAAKLHARRCESDRNLYIARYIVEKYARSWLRVRINYYY